MAENSPIARSPIAVAPPETLVGGWAVSGRSSDAALTMTDCTPLAKVTIKATWDGAMSKALGVRLGHTARQTWKLGPGGDQVLLVGSGPGEWLVLAAPGCQALVTQWLTDLANPADEHVSIVDLTHGRALVRLTGSRSPDLLAKECGVDLSEAVLPDRAALRSAVAGVATDIVRDDVNETRSYLLHCERSSGQYLVDSLLDAGAEYDIDVDGFVPPGIYEES
ncbi:MAG: sarcosine oxidase subunit gamma family protein [Nocardioidaceae bacterium]